MKLIVLLTALMIPAIVGAQATYRLKQPTWTAIQWTGANLAAVEAFMAPAVPGQRSGFLIIDTADGRKYAGVNDWVTKSVPDLLIDVMKAADFTRFMELVP